MLFGLLLLGLLPMAFVMDPHHAHHDDEEDGHDDDQNSAAAGPAAEPAAPAAAEHGDLLDQALGGDADSDPAPEEDPDGGADFNLDAEPGETEISGFDPGHDHLTINVHAQGVSYFSSSDPEEPSASLHLGTGPDASVFTFPGLHELPLGDITINLIDPQSGDAQSFGLAEYHDDTALEPDDPSQASALTPGEGEDALSCGPADEASVLAPALPEDGAALAPDLPDDPAQDTEDTADASFDTAGSDAGSDPSTSGDEATPDAAPAPDPDAGSQPDGGTTFTAGADGDDALIEAAAMPVDDSAAQLAGASG